MKHGATVAVSIAAFLAGVAIVGPESPAEPVPAVTAPWDADTESDRPESPLIYVAEDGTVTINHQHDDGTVTGVVVLPDGSSFQFPEVEEDDPRWDCATMGNRVCGKHIDKREK